VHTHRTNVVPPQISLCSPMFIWNTRVVSRWLFVSAQHITYRRMKDLSSPIMRDTPAPCPCNRVSKPRCWFKATVSRWNKRSDAPYSPISRGSEDAILSHSSQWLHWTFRPSPVLVGSGPCFPPSYRAVRVVVHGLGRGSIPRALCQLVYMPQKAARVDFKSNRRWAKTALPASRL
jgi:hypothetical protein